MFPLVRPMARAVAMALPVALLLATAPTAGAQTTAITSRADMSGSTINWNTMYPGGTVPAAFTPTGIPGLSVRPFATAVTVATEGNGWNGGFTTGDPVLIGNNPQGGALGLLFNADVFGFGANLQGLNYGVFDGRIEAFDINGNLLGQYAPADLFTSSSTRGTAPFFGIRSTTAIRLISFNVNYANTTEASLGINQAIVEMGSPSTVVPEPSTVVLLAAGLASLALATRRRTRLS